MNLGFRWSHYRHHTTTQWLQYRLSGWYKEGFTADTNDVVPLGVVNTSRCALICLCTAHNILTESVLSGKFLSISIFWMSYSATVSCLYMCLNWYVCTHYIYVFIDMFVYLVQYNIGFYFSWEVYSIYLTYMSYSTTTS